MLGKCFSSLCLLSFVGIALSLESVSITYNVTYRDERDALRPLANVRVGLYILYSIPLCTCTTRSNGLCECFIRSAPTPEGTVGHTYVYSYGDHVVVGTGVYEPNPGIDPYNVEGPDVTLYSHGFPHKDIIGIFSETNLGSVYTHISDIALRIASDLQLPHYEVQVEYPSESTKFDTYTLRAPVVFVNEELGDSIQVIGFLQGYNTMHSINRGEPTYSDYISPCRTDNEDRAYYDGYAIAFSMIITGDPYNGSFVYGYGPDETIEVEHYECRQRSMTYDAYRCAAALYDLHDSYNDCNQGDEYKGSDYYCDENDGHTLNDLIIFILPLEQTGTTSIAQYYYSLIRILPDTTYKGLSEDIFLYNWANFIYDI